MASSDAIEFRPSLDKVRAALRKRINDIKDRSVPNRQIATYLWGWVQRNFAEQGAPVGGWTPFAAGGRYISGVGLDTSAKLLQDTGALRQSFTTYWDKNVVSIGSDLEYSKYHEEGTATIPRRRILPTIKDVGDKIVDIYNRWLKQKTQEPMW